MTRHFNYGILPWHSNGTYRSQYWTFLLIIMWLYASIYFIIYFINCVSFLYFFVINHTHIIYGITEVTQCCHLYYRYWALKFCLKWIPSEKKRERKYSGLGIKNQRSAAGCTPPSGSASVCQCLCSYVRHAFSFHYIHACIHYEAKNKILNVSPPKQLPTNYNLFSKIKQNNWRNCKKKILSHNFSGWSDV